MHFDRMKCIKKLNLIKLEDKLSKYFFTKEYGLFAIRKEYNTIEFISFRLINFSHKQLKIINIKFGIN